jgi:hypothetical protein
MKQNTWHNKTFSYLVEKHFQYHITDTFDEKSGEVYTPQPKKPLQTQFVMDDQFDEVSLHLQPHIYDISSRHTHIL